MLAQMQGEQLAVPDVLVIAQLAWGSLQILRNFHTVRCGQPAWAAGAQAFPQPAAAAGGKTMHPPLDRGRMLTQPGSHRRAGMALAHQQHPVQPMIIPRFGGALDLLLHGDSRGLRMVDSQSFHTQTVRERRDDGKTIIMHYLRRYWI